MTLGLPVASASAMRRQNDPQIEVPVVERQPLFGLFLSIVGQDDYRDGTGHV